VKALVDGYWFGEAGIGAGSPPLLSWSRNDRRHERRAFRKFPVSSCRRWSRASARACRSGRTRWRWRRRSTPPPGSACCPKTAWRSSKGAASSSRCSTPAGRPIHYRDGLFRPCGTRPAGSPTCVPANLSAFLQTAGRQEDPDTLFFKRELSIVGDTELGLRVKNMLDAIEWPQLAATAAFRH
jgi:hypothetical protein